MPAIVTKAFRVHTAQQLVESLTEAANNQYYLAIGRVESWSDDNNPPTPTDAIANSHFDYWRDLMAAKRVGPNDVCHVVPRYNWSANTVYVEYDHRNANLYAQTFYVLTSNFDVYKCLFNNGGANSTIEPTGTSNTVITTGDGYKWKFLYNIPTSDALKFLTDAYMPVRTLDSDNGTTQWDVQEYAAASNGALDVLKVTAGGTNYDPSTTTVVITGDGSGATVNSVGITISSNAITGLLLATRGADYSNAVVTISSSGTGNGATAVAMVPPVGYHGADPISELGANYVMLNLQLANSEANTITTVNNYRRILLLRDPLLANGSIATANLYNQTTRVLLTGATGSFTADEVVTGGTSGATGVVVDWNQAGNANTVRLVAVTGTFQVAEIITGGSSGVTGTVSSITQPELKFFSGDVLYVEQRTPVARSAEQTESIKLVVQT